MVARGLGILVIVAGGLIFLLALAWPTVALVGRCFTQEAPGRAAPTSREDAGRESLSARAEPRGSGEAGGAEVRGSMAAPTDGFSYSRRQLGLLGRSVWLAACATLVALVLSLPGAYVVGRMGSLARHPLLVMLLGAVLLFPPMVYTFGWQRLLPVGFPGGLSCIGVWALWGWPIPALIVGTGWIRTGRASHEAALLATTPGAAFVRVGLPLLRRYVLLSALLLFILFTGDYGVPHACGLRVYATELLGWAQNSSLTIDTVWPALPAVGVTLVALVVVVLLWRCCLAEEEVEVEARPEAFSATGLTLIALVCFAVSFMLPVGWLVFDASSFEALRRSFEVYQTDMVWSLGLALAGGTCAVVMGMGVTALGRWGNVGLAWAVLSGALPGALIGAALVAGYQAVPVVYDYAPIIVLAYVARYGWIGVLVAWLARRASTVELRAQAESDGAGSLDRLTCLDWPLAWPTLVGGVGVVTALSLGEVAATALVRVPALRLCAHVIIEKFHRLEDDMLIALSLWLMLVILPVAGLLCLVLRGRRPRVGGVPASDLGLGADRPPEV